MIQFQWFLKAIHAEPVQKTNWSRKISVRQSGTDILFYRLFHVSSASCHQAFLFVYISLELLSCSWEYLIGYLWWYKSCHSTLAIYKCSSQTNLIALSNETKTFNRTDLFNGFSKEKNIKINIGLIIAEFCHPNYYILPCLIYYFIFKSSCLDLNKNARNIDWSDWSNMWLGLDWLASIYYVCRSVLMNWFSYSS
jgi:hypothetical protein